MKHAIMIMGFGNPSVAQATISHLDSDSIDFFIHWDQKYMVPNFKSKHSKIIYTSNRINVKWGQYSEILAEEELLKTVQKSSEKYSYVHLISSSDIPLFTIDYFKDFFDKDAYIGYQHPDLPRLDTRLKFYYLISRINVRNKLWLVKVIKIVNYLLFVDRLRGRSIQIKWGPQWFSLNAKYIGKLLAKDDSIFKNTFLGSEEYIQMSLPQFDVSGRKDTNIEAARYIKWEGYNEPHPKTFTMNDIDELREIINTKYAFARKVNDPNIIWSLFQDR